MIVYATFFDVLATGAIVPMSTHQYESMNLDTVRGARRG